MERQGHPFLWYTHGFLLRTRYSHITSNFKGKDKGTAIVGTWNTVFGVLRLDMGRHVVAKDGGTLSCGFVGLWMITEVAYYWYVATWIMLRS